jgi:hypothetical protein
MATIRFAGLALGCSLMPNLNGNANALTHQFLCATALNDDHGLKDQQGDARKLT